jgi:hypothetical protein
MKKNEDIQKYKDMFGKCKKAWGDIYEQARQDMNFLSGKEDAQWTAKERSDRDGRITLTVDRLSQIVHQVANDIRMNTPSIKVIPSGKQASQEVAEIMGGLIRNIEYESNADDAYDSASLSAVRCGIGFIRVVPEIEDDETQDQRLLIKKIINPLAVYLDPRSINSDGSDANYAFILDEIEQDEFEEKYPKKDAVSFEKEDKTTTEKKNKPITIAEYFKKERDKETGKIVIRHMILSGNEVLEETTFPGQYIPIVPVYGEEFWVENERNLLSVHRRARDAQRMYNYWVSLETEILQKQPNAPIMAAVGQTEDFAKEWSNPTKSMVLRWKPVNFEGTVIGQPDRLAPPSIPAGVVNASRERIEDIKATTGIYDASLGARSNETSGVAIQRRQNEGDTATFHFADNLNRSIAQVGRILVSAIHEIYDRPRIIRIVDLEEESHPVAINGEMLAGQEKTFDLTTGRYDVKVITGAPFTTRRQEAADFFTKIIQSQPQLMTVMGDLLFKNMDFPGAEAMSERMKRMIDPKLLNENQDPAVDALTSQLQQLQAELAAAQQELQSKEGETQLKVYSEQRKNELEQAKLMLQKEENDTNTQIKSAELEIKAKELLIKEQELMLKAREMELSFAQTQIDNENKILAQALVQDTSHDMLMESAS